jgi:hypothetical protein
MYRRMSGRSSDLNHLRFPQQEVYISSYGYVRGTVLTGVSKIKNNFLKSGNRVVQLKTVDFAFTEENCRKSVRKLVRPYPPANGGNIFLLYIRVAL